MENIRVVIKITKFFIGSVFLIAPIFIYAYEADTTHNALTQETVVFFEHYNSKRMFSSGERSAIMRGSIAEDENTRPLNHFYDPVYQTGMSLHEISKEWAEDTIAQAIRSPKYVALLGHVTQSFFGADTDFSWDRAVYEYVHGDKERGLEALGHVLHLIQDKTVPPHTRNDPHPPYFDEFFEQESPYEHFAKRYTADTIDIAKQLVADGVQPVYYRTLGEYFDTLAIYTNRNFFSKDTIFDEKYNGPKIINYEKEYLSGGQENIFGYGALGSDYRLIRVEKKFDPGVGDFIEDYFINDDDNLILADYWNILSARAVTHGAGVIQLFFDEVDREKQTLALYKKNRSFVGMGIDTTKKVAMTVTNTIVSTTKKVAIVTSHTVSAAANAAKTMTNSIINTTNFLIQFTTDNVSSDDLIASSVPGFSEKIERNDTHGVINTPQAAPISRIQNNQNPQSDQSIQQFIIEPEVAIELDSESDISNLVAMLDIAEQQVNSLQRDITALSSEVLTVNSQESEAQQTEQDIGGTVDNDIQTPGYTPGFGGGASPFANAQTVISENADDKNMEDSSANPNDTDDDDNIGENFASSTPPSIPIAVTVSSPKDISRAFTETTIVFSGTSTPNTFLSNSISNATTTTDETGEWNFSILFPQGSSTVQFFAEKNGAESDESGGVASSTPLDIFVDSVAPNIDLSIDNCVSGDETCLLSTTTVNVSWASLSTDFNHFVFEYDGVATTTMATSTALTMEDESSHLVKIYAYDNAGNISSQSVAVDVSSYPVIINEIAWAGTNAGFADEWIELYNKTGTDIDLSGWTLAGIDGAPYIPLSGIVSAGGFYLIERTDDNTVSDIAADLVVSFSGVNGSAGLGNAGEELILFHASTTVDHTPASTLWIAGSNKTGAHASMERYSAWNVGDDIENWDTALYYLSTGRDADGGRIIGTPRARNSITHVVNNGRDVIADTHISRKNNPNLIRGKVFVAPGAALYIDPGAVVLFAPDAEDTSELWVYGEISASGTSDEPIVFTTYEYSEYIPYFSSQTDRERFGSIRFFDDAYGEFTNVSMHDILGPVVFDDASAGDFSNVEYYDNATGIWINDGAVIDLNTVEMRNIDRFPITAYDSSTVSIQHTLFENIHKNMFDIITFAGDTLWIDDVVIRDAEGKDAISVFGEESREENISISGLHVSGEYQDAVDFYDVASLVVEDCTVYNPVGTAFGIYDTNMIFDGNTVHGSNIGFEIYGGALVMADNIFYENNESVSLYNVEAFISGNTLRNNTIGMTLWEPTVFIDHNAFYDNDMYGMMNATWSWKIEENPEYVVLAQNNWWGDVTGPYHPEKNLEGLGNRVSDNIVFEPFLEEEML